MIDTDEYDFDAKSFPPAIWGDSAVVFVPADFEPLEKCAAVLCFPFYGDKIVLADNIERGWCIPAGGVEAGESPSDALHRESLEEAGLTLGKVRCIGWYILTNPLILDDRRVCPTYIAEVRHIGDWTDKEEVRGVQLVNTEDVADLYYRWDALMAHVFAYAEQQRQTLFAPGVSLSDFMRE